jgi:hypothetical protein
MTNGINFDSNTFVIDPNSNRVGIGTTAPGAKLEVIGGDVRLGGGATSYKTYFGTTAADEYYDAENRRLYFYGAANAYIGYYTTLSTLDLRANGGQRFLVGATERMRLGPSGGLSLGSTYVGTDPGAGSMIIEGNVGIESLGSSFCERSSRTAVFRHRVVNSHKSDSRQEWQRRHRDGESRGITYIKRGNDSK